MVKKLFHSSVGTELFGDKMTTSPNLIRAVIDVILFAFQKDTDALIPIKFVFVLKPTCMRRLEVTWNCHTRLKQDTTKGVWRTIST